MAEPSNVLPEKSLKSFCASLEDLTFNSKPIIDDLTRFASSYRQFAPQIAQKIEERILEVEWTLLFSYFELNKVFCTFIMSSVCVRVLRYLVNFQCTEEMYWYVCKLCIKFSLKLNETDCVRSKQCLQRNRKSSLTGSTRMETSIPLPA